MIQCVKQQGMTLIEVLVTVVVLAVGLLGLSSLQTTSVKAGNDIAQRSQALWLVNDLVERMRTNPEGWLDYDTVDTANCPTDITNCSDHGSTDTDAQSCSPSELAAFDMWEVACGQAQAAGTLSNAVDTMDITSLNIDCVENCNSPQAVYDISLVYDSNLVNSSKLMGTNRTDQTPQTITIRAYPSYAPE